jgi:hypothetical protein
MSEKLTQQELHEWERDWNFRRWEDDLFKKEVIFVEDQKAKTTAKIKIKELIDGPCPGRKLLAAPRP